MAKKKSKNSGKGKKGGGKAHKSEQASAKSKESAGSKDAKSKDSAESEESAKDAKSKDSEGAEVKASLPKAEALSGNKGPSDAQPPELVNKLVMVDNAIGYVEQAFLVVVLFSLIGVGTYQFVASHLFKVNSTWPFEALRNLVFFTAMGGAALAAQKGRMISMDFLSRKLSPKNRVILRIFITFFVVFTCFLLFKGGMYVRNAAGAHYEVFNPKTALLVLPLGAALIGVHYILHALTDALYLSAGLIPPEEEGPAAH